MERDVFGDFSETKEADLVVQSIEGVEPSGGKEQDDNVEPYSGGVPNIVEAYIGSIRNIPILTRQDEAALAELIAQGDRAAYEKFVQSNLRLAVSIARRYIGNNVSFEDLIQAANIGLMRAVPKFDPTRGCKFSTHATWWIEQEVQRVMLQQRHTISSPVNVQAQAAKLRRAGFADEEMPDDCQAASRTAFTVYLDAYVGGDESNGTYGESVSDAAAADDFERVDGLCGLREALETFFDVLTIQERTALKLRYGWHDGRSRTLEEVHREMGISRERVRQLEQRAVVKLRESSRGGYLREFIE